jgi:hypothetical protein
MRNSYYVFIGKPGRKRPLGRPRLRWEDNIRMDIRKIEWKGVDWIHLAQDRANSGLLSTWQWTSSFRKSWEIS